jgi:esterase/lipase
MNKWKVLGFVLAVLVLVAFGVVASYLQAKIFISNPPKQRSPIDGSPADYGLVYEEVDLTTEDGYNLAAWYVPSRNQAAVILVHGYKSDRMDVLSRAKVLARRGYGIMMIDLRTHGESDGELITFGLYEVRDVNAAYRYLLTRSDVGAERIGVQGFSVGGGVVILHAAQNPGIKAVVSESAFVSLEDEVPVAVANAGLPSFLLAPLVQWFAEREGGFEAKDVAAVEHIGKISPRPVFLMQGGMDVIVPPDSGQRLYDAAGEPRELWFDPEIGHVAFLEERTEEFETRVVGFFDQYLLKEE